MPRDTRETLDNKIRELNDSILELGSTVEQAVLGCVKALEERDLETAKNIYHQDKMINEKRKIILSRLGSNTFLSSLSNTKIHMMIMAKYEEFRWIIKDL